MNVILYKNTNRDEFRNSQSKIKEFMKIILTKTFTKCIPITLQKSSTMSSTTVVDLVLITLSVPPEI